MTDSGAERAARRIAEQENCDAPLSPETMEYEVKWRAAIIREETGTQFAAEFDIYEAKDADEIWVTVKTSAGTAAFGSA